MRNRRPNRRRLQRRNESFKKLVTETVLTVLKEDAEFYKIQKDAAKKGQKAYEFESKTNPFWDKENSDKQNPAPIQGKEAEYAFCDAFTKWAESNSLRGDITSNVMKLVGAGDITPNFDQANEESFKALYQQGKDIVGRQRGKIEGDPAKGKAILDKKPLAKPEDVVELFNGLNAQDGQDVQAALLNGENDGDGNTDKVAVTPVDKTCSTMKATQTFIDAGQSVAYPLFFASTYIMYVKQDNATIPAKNAGGRISVAENFILDGHHRWSGMYSVNPTLKIQAVNFKFSNVEGDSKADAQQALANMQKAVGSMVEPGQRLPAKSGNPDLNILDKNKADILDMIQTMYDDGEGEEGPILNDKWCQDVLADQAAVDAVVAKCAAANITEGQALASNPDADTLRKAVIPLTAHNLNQLVTTSGSPIGKTIQDLPREMMPQLDHPQIGGAQGLNAIRTNLQQGRIDVADPKNESIDLRRWNKLAGLLKD